MRATALAHFLDKLLAVDDEAVAARLQSRDADVRAVDHRARRACAASSTTIRPSGGTALYDAIDAALPLFESRQHPRAALLLVSDGADTASDMTPTILKQKLVRSDVFLYAIGIDSLDARNSTRINPFTLQRADQPGRRLHRDHPQHRRARPGDRTDRRGAEQSIHDRLHADDARRRQVPQRPRQVTNDTYRVRARRGVVR